MNLTRTFSFKILLLFGLMTISFPQHAIAQSKRFVVAIDPGHGGKDFGAARNYFVEKNIALGVALKLEKILKNTSGIDVVLTRKSDVFVDLQERADIANRADANLFISLHCNSNDNAEAYGTETYVTGKAKNTSNAEAAKRENMVIIMEKDFKERYSGIDPADSESVAASLTSDEFLDNSINIAGKIESQFRTDLNSKSRGVKMAPYIILNKVYMPRVLVEMGFISNAKEGAFLDSEEGQQEIAEALAKAIVSYRKDAGNAATNTSVRPSSKVESTPAVVESQPASSVETPVTRSAKGIIFRVQISASGKKLDPTPANFKGLTNITVANEGGTLYKYMYGEATDYETAKRNLAEAKTRGFETAYIVAFRDGVKIKLQEALQ